MSGDRSIRPARTTDLPRLREICIKTGAAGGDATGRWSTDDLLPDLFLEPYLTYAIGWAWVVEDKKDGPVGYLVAVPDTIAFSTWWRKRWTPWFGERYPRAHPARSPEEELIELGFDPEQLLIDEVDEYPAHLHLDLLPDAQGAGLGRDLVQTLLKALARDKVPGVHLTMDPANIGGREFYSHVGFEELPSSTPSRPVLGRRVADR